MKNPSRRWLSLCVALSFLVGCATAPKPVPHGATREKFVDQQLSSQEAEIRRLTHTIESLERRLQTHAPSANTPSTASVPLTRLTPDAPEDEDVPLEEGWDEDDVSALQSDPTPMREANVIADSRSEHLNHYFRGLHYFDEKRFEKARSEFHAFLQDEPEHVYADRAQYMELESEFENHDYSLAVFTANQLEARYPYSLRLPDAMHKRALSYLEMGQQSQAAVTLRELLRRFPDAPIADSASRLLGGIGTPKDAADLSSEWEGKNKSRSDR